MKGVLIGALVLLLIAGAGLGTLLMMAEAGTPEPAETRIEVTDELRSNR